MVASLGLLLAIAAPASAKRMYKYQDAEGRWHYSDVAPDTDREVEVQRLEVTAQEPRFRLRRTGTEAEPTFVIVNGYHGPLEVELRLVEAVNVVARPRPPARFIVPAASELAAMTLRPKRGARRYAYRLSHLAMLGDSRARHRPQKPYRAPFALGTRHPVTQGFHGAFSHTEAHSRYAVDFGLPEGTRVHAARAGIVMDLANDFYAGGTDPDRYRERANHIRILHDDGTMALYGHLALETAQVVPGSPVREGQFIAESGNTGYSTGPHLHFVIQRNAGMRIVSEPFVLQGEDGQPVTPKRGMMVTAH